MRDFDGVFGLPQVATRLRLAGCVFAEEEAELLLAAASSERELADLLQRRVGGEPLEYVLGWAGFLGIRITVAEGVFIPRRRTEFLAATAIAAAEAGAVVLELCCGAGAVASVLADAVPSAELHAADLLPAAADCARKNLAGRATVYVGDLFEPLPASLRGRIDVVVANPPYVPTRRFALLPREARQFEPAEALDGGSDGLAVASRIAAEAPHWLRPGGRLFVECSAEQASELSARFSAAGLLPATLHESGLEATVLSGTRPLHAQERRS